jgi:N-acetylglucosaminyldiphosphoundecaprenol N-acetyl-beta-D-mannosaminyltransferase
MTSCSAGTGGVVREAAEPHERSDLATTELTDLQAAKRVNVLGCPVDALTLEQTVSRCLELIEGDGGRQMSVNASKVVLCDSDSDLSGALSRAEVVSADGVPIVWASWALGSPLPGRVNGTDLMEELMLAGSDLGLRVFILGATTPVLHRAVARVQEWYPGLVIVGTRHGYFAPEEEGDIIRAINDAKVDLLFLAMGSPVKELWLDRNWDRLNVGLAMGVGGSVDVIAGLYPRAPRWMQRSGLEWLHRFGIEPRRMWRRYLFGNARFVRIFGRELMRRWSNDGGARGQHQRG